jgi:tRNA dimethylallyltransferase
MRLLAAHSSLTRACVRQLAEQAVRGSLQLRCIPLPLREAQTCPQARAARADTAGASSPLPKVLVLAGPTASGKTALSLALAHALHGEVVSADSVQVYTGLDVGSAKLPLAERQGVRHHLLDVVPPTVEFSAAHWLDAALEAVTDCVSRGRTPIVVGGAGFYLRWLTAGRPPTPRSEAHSAAAARARLQAAADKAVAEAQAARASIADAPVLSAQEVEELRWRAALQVLHDAGDPESAQRLVPNDWYRAERVLEIVTLSGRPVASFEPDDGAVRSRFQFRCFFLGVPRMQLYRRIDARCESMLANGLLPEAAALWAAGARPWDDGAHASPAGRSIGYAQALELLATAVTVRGEPVACEAALDSCLAAMQRASRNYAKRQHTWFRGEGAYRWVDTTAGFDACLDDILTHFSADVHVPCTKAADAAIMADAGEEGAGAAHGEPEQKPPSAKVVKARNRALMCYTPQRGPHLDDAAVARLCSWISGWAQQQPDLTAAEADALARHRLGGDTPPSP